MHTKENWFFFSASRCTASEAMVKGNNKKYDTVRISSLQKLLISCYCNDSDKPRRRSVTPLLRAIGCLRQAKNWTHQLLGTQIEILDFMKFGTLNSDLKNDNHTSSQSQKHSTATSRTQIGVILNFTEF